MPELTFSLLSFSACSPSTGCISSSTQNFKWDPHAQIEGWMPDTSFVPNRKFHRISRLSKMALYAAYHAKVEAQKTHKLSASIFFSRFGELQHTERVLSAVHAKELVSPMDFSYSVHNTAQGLFSILQDENTPATAIASRYDGLENALVKAFSQLKDGSEAVMIVYHEDTLPEIYEDYLKPDIMPLAFAFVVGKDDDNAPNLNLSFTAKITEIESDYNNIHACNIAKMLGRKEGQVTLETNRLKWNWQLR